MIAFTHTVVDTCESCGVDVEFYDEFGTAWCPTCYNLHQRYGSVLAPDHPPLQESLMPALTLSHSQVKTWQTCPQKWKLEKLDQAPAAPNDAFLFGTAIHAALEADGRAKLDQQPPLQDFKLLAVFDQVLQDELRQHDPDGLFKGRIADLRRRAMAILQTYIKLIQPSYQPLVVEQDFQIALAGIPFRGRIDAITATSIVDWKTSTKPWEAETSHQDDQATAYLLARPDQTRVSFAVFSGIETCHFQSLATTRSGEQKMTFTTKVHAVATEIKAAKKSGDFPSRPGPFGSAGGCQWCPYVGSCTAGETWLKLAGKLPSVPVVRP